MAEDHFGQLMLQTEVGEAFSLDLYETPDIVFRGFYLPPSTTLLNRMGYQELPEIPHELSYRPSWVRADVELVIERRALVELRETTNMTRTAYPDGHQYFEMRHTYFELWGDLSLGVHSEEQGRELWTGRVAGMGSMAGKGFDFVMEQFGSVEPITLVAGILVLIYLERRTSQASAECYSRATEACGTRGIREFKINRRVLSITNLGFSNDCSFICN
jgi:hypothetical protein